MEYKSKIRKKRVGNTPPFFGNIGRVLPTLLPYGRGRTLSIFVVSYCKGGF